jgi:pimeloyl-ACP methyl ester carboxylesterase
MAWADPFTKHSTVKVGKTEAHVAELGTGQPVVMLHGNPDTHACWASTASRLSGVRVIAPDLPGFGKTAAPDDFTFTLEEQGEWVRELVAALGLDRLHLVVHDVGGIYGLAFATLHPQRLQTLTILNTSFFPDLKWHFWARVWRTRGLGGFAQLIANRPLFVRELRRGSPNMPREYADHAYDQFHAHAKKTVLKWYRAHDPEVWTGWDARMLEATAQVPTQVIWGDKDPFLVAPTADRFGARDVKHVEHGHWVMLEDPELTASSIDALVRRHPLSA